MIPWLVLKSGTILNFIGSIMIAFSVGANRGGALQCANGEPVAVVKSLALFKWGIIVMITGFAISVFDNKCLAILGMAISNP